MITVHGSDPLYANATGRLTMTESGTVNAIVSGIRNGRVTAPGTATENGTESANVIVTRTDLRVEMVMGVVVVVVAMAAVVLEAEVVAAEVDEGQTATAMVTTTAVAASATIMVTARIGRWRSVWDYERTFGLA